MKCKKSDVDTVELGEELLVREKKGQQMHRLNRTAAAVWKLCDGEKDVSEIAAHLARDFRGWLEEEMEGDVRAALEEMAKLGIVKSCG